jgi:hypothetical protein
MSLSKSTPGEDLIREGNIRAKKPKSGYTPARGDILVYDASLTDGVDRGATNENPDGYCLSINSSNGTVSMVQFRDGVTIIVEYDSTATSPTDLLKKVECSGDRGTIYPTRDRLRIDDSNGKTGSKVLAIDYPATGLMVVQFD